MENFLCFSKVVSLLTFLNKIIVFVLYRNKYWISFAPKKEIVFIVYCSLGRSNLLFTLKAYLKCFYLKCCPGFQLNLLVFEGFMLKLPGLRLCKVGRSACGLWRTSKNELLNVNEKYLLFLKCWKRENFVKFFLLLIKSQKIENFVKVYLVFRAYGFFCDSTCTRNNLCIINTKKKKLPYQIVSP